MILLHNVCSFIPSKPWRNTATNTNTHTHRPTLHYKANMFIQSDLQLIRPSRGQSPQEQCEVKGLAQEPTPAWPVLWFCGYTELQWGLNHKPSGSPIKQVSHKAIGCPPTEISIKRVNAFTVIQVVLNHYFTKINSHLQILESCLWY